MFRTFSLTSTHKMPMQRDANIRFFAFEPHQMRWACPEQWSKLKQTSIGVRKPCKSWSCIKKKRTGCLLVSQQKIYKPTPLIILTSHVCPYWRATMWHFVTQRVKTKSTSESFWIFKETKISTRWKIGIHTLTHTCQTDWVAREKDQT